MRFAFALAALAAPALAQINQTYVDGVVNALKGANLTALATAIQGVANTTAGTQLLTALSSGNNYTVFAPNNAASAAVPKNVTSNSTLVGDIITYHVVPGSFNTSSFATSPNHTIVNTLLNDTSIVKLGANKSAVIVATATQDGGNTTVEILNQAKNVTVQASTTFQNLIIHVINGVLTPPPTLPELISSAGLSSLLTAASTANVTDAVVNSQGLTIFAPNNAAFTKALASLGAQANNATLIQAVLANHIINGTEVYSTQFFDGTHTSAAGQQFTFNTTSNGTVTVTSGNATANIVRADIPFANGVAHIIDTVLANPNVDQGAASSAYQSATSAAAANPTQSGPVGSSGGNNNGAVPLTQGSFSAIASAFVVSVAAAFAGSALVL
jgi:uncharacterized surface protein with fasciclin (FAS1) repeats